jgi:hypothetical protein
MNSTIEFLMAVGSPYENRPAQRSHENLVCLYELSKSNRMPFFFLHQIGRANLGQLAGIYDKEYTRLLDTYGSMTRASTILESGGIDHAFFKTIRPYLSTTVDLDILVMRERQDSAKAILAMQKNGYKLLVYGPMSTTLLDEEIEIGIDLYDQVAVSFVTYINKELLRDHVMKLDLPNSTKVYALSPEADLACLIAHSMIKEQMYTLSEYYTYVYYLDRLDIDGFVDIVRRSNTTLAARTHSTITALLHKTAHRYVPEKLQEILCRLGEENFESSRLIKNSLRVPHKYHLLTVLRSFIEISGVATTRNSIPLQLVHMLNPRISKDVLKKLTDHLRRETY